MNPLYLLIYFTHLSGQPEFALSDNMARPFGQCTILANAANARFADAEAGRRNLNLGAGYKKYPFWVDSGAYCQQVK